jgi:hypothetical protein
MTRVASTGAAGAPEIRGGSGTPPLLPHHRDLLVAAGIATEVMQARGYRSTTSQPELERLGATIWRTKGRAKKVLAASLGI